MEGTLKSEQPLLALRGDLRFEPRRSGDRTLYVVEDPATGKFYQFGFAEYTFLSLLDGRTTAQRALELTNRALGNETFRPDEAAAICRWLCDAGLVVASSPTESRRPPALRETSTGGRRRGWLHPLFIKVPLARPERLFQRLSPWWSWLHSPPALLLWCLVCAAAVGTAVVEWDRLTASSADILAPSNWAWLAATWLGLKLIHECSHGLACKRYGGTVGEMGLVFVLFAPLAYVDVTSSWRFRSKWQRIHTAAAGMIAELFMAALCVFVWCLTDSPLIRQHLLNVIAMASLATVVFNANPLMRFDGYYILADLMELPNLSRSARQDFSALVRKLLLGISSPVRRLPGFKGWFIRAYGIAAWLWRNFVCLCLIMAAAVLWHGAGLILAVTAAVLWIGGGLTSLWKTLSRPEIRRQVRVWRLAATGTCCAAMAAVAWWALSVPAVRRVPGVVDYEPLAVVRADSDGFIESVHVRHGEVVESGQVLVQLVNEELTNELSELDVRLRESEIKARTFARQEQTAAWQVELKQAESLRRQRSEKQAQVERLTVRAPMSGRVIARNLEAMVGTYAESGTELLAVGDDRQKRLVVSVSQDDASRLKSQDSQVDIFIRGRSVMAGTVSRITPRGTVSPPHPALCAPHGGWLAVQQTEPANAGADGFQFVEPRFTAYIDVPAEATAAIWPGETARITFTTGDETLGQSCYRSVAGWFEQRLAHAGWRSF